MSAKLEVGLIFGIAKFYGKINLLSNFEMEIDMTLDSIEAE